MAAKQTPTSDPDIVELRQEYQYASDEKREIREEGALDMLAVSGDIWAAEDPTGKERRDDANRPIIDPDELSQYVNAAINDVRQNKRSIRVAQQGRGATDKTAEFRQNLIRQIEYRSKAPSAAYAPMYENTLQRSYGYLRVVPEYVNYRSNDQELRIKGIQNPDMVTEDPTAQETDGAGWKFMYFEEFWRRSEVKRRFPKAKITDFDGALRAQPEVAKTWLKNGGVVMAERWRIVTKPRKLYLVTVPPPSVDPALRTPAQAAPAPQYLFEDELKVGKLPKGATIQELRTVDYPYVKKQITNGLEILEETDFPGTSIPFVACYGKVLYLDTGSGAKKRLLSLIRLARSPMMLYAYYRTQQAEMAGMIPKTPIGGYKGQFAGLENDYERMPHEPIAFVEFNFTTDGWSPEWGPMPKPERLGVSQADHMQALELCAEGARRAIQAAIGTSPLPTQAQRHNEKSGVALQKIDDQMQRGSFHFVDHFDDAITRTGIILDELIPFYYDTARDVSTRDGRDQLQQVRINDPNHPQAISATDGDHDVTLSVGPRESSEREAASNFADLLVGSPQLLQAIGPEKTAQVIALAIRLKAVGPIGDEIADIIAPQPPQDGEPPSPQQVQQMQQQLQGLSQKLQQAQQIIAGKQIEAQEKARIQLEIEKVNGDLQIKLQEMKNANAALVARIAADKERSNLQTEAAEERLSTGLTLDHQAAEAEKDRAHEVGIAALDHAHTTQQADQAHGQTLEQAAVGHANALDAQAAAAAQQPPADGNGGPPA
jgi:hypothetical protein